MRVSSRSDHVHDQGWAWLVLAAGFGNCVISMGIALGSGVYVAEVIKYYDVHKMAGAIVGSLTFGTAFFIGPVCSLFINMTSHRTVIMTGSVMAAGGCLVSAHVHYIEWLYVTYGIITGVGLGFIFGPTMIIIPLYFRKYRGITNGVASAGVGAGGIILPVLTRFLIDKYSWKPSMYVMAGICLQSCVFGAIMRPVLPETISLTVTSDDDTKQQENSFSKHIVSWLTVITNIPFIFFLANIFLSMLGTSTALIMLPDMFTELRLSSWEIDTLLISVGVGNVIGRLSAGVFSNLNRVSNLLLYAFINGICGVFVLVFGLSAEFTWLMVASLGFGTLFGALMTLITLSVIEILGLSSLGNGVGLTFFASGVGIVLGPVLAGAIFDATHTYSWSFIVGAVINTIGALLVIPGYLCLRRHRRNAEHRRSRTTKTNHSEQEEQHTFILDS